MSFEVDLIEDYFKAFNAHDLEGVVAFFADDAVITAGDGSRHEGTAEVRNAFAWYFDTFSNAHCELKRACGSDGTGAAESVFTGTRRDTKRQVRTAGAELLSLRGDKICELREYQIDAAE